MIRFECPDCAARLEIDESRGGRSMTCPFCKGQVAVPMLYKPRRRREYASTMSDTPVARGKLTNADIEALENDEEPHTKRKKKRRRPKLEWQLFVGGFGFPWSPGAVMQWLLIAMWASVAGWLIHSAIVLGISDRGLVESNVYQTIVAFLAAMGALVAGLSCAGVTAIFGLTILLETTAGNDRIEDWPNVALFLDWIGDLWFIFNAAVVSVTLGLCVAWMSPEFLETRAATVAIAVFCVFPIVLLSVLETDSPFLPVSSVVIASLWRYGIAWLAFYAQAGGLLAAVSTAFDYLALQRVQPPLAIAIAAMLFSAVVMIYFRLLGRLAYFCSLETGKEDL